MYARRVVITGIGLVSPMGSGPDAAFNRIMCGDSAVRRISLVIGDRTFSLPAAAVTTPLNFLFGKSQRSLMDAVSQYALAAATSAVADSCISLPEEDLTRFGTSVGTCMGGITSTEDAYHELFGQNANRVAPFTLVRTMYNAPAAHIAIALGLAGPALTYTTTCSSSTIAVGEAMRVIRHGYADVMIAGGTEALLAFGAVRAWQALRILAPEDPVDAARTCRPFCLNRKGTTLGEGAVFIVLEEYERASRRGAPVRAELVGYGVTNDSDHLTQPSVDGQARTMRAALNDANLPGSAIDYLNAHGTGTQLNDVTETRAIKAVFEKDAYRMAVSSTKSMHGHMVGATGAMELAISILALQRQEVPPTANLSVADPECDLDYVPNIGRAHRVRAAMSNSFAFGGTSGALVIRQVH
jgi:3-oxoacyl-(acyl-carrier-protein) synthase